MSVVPIGKNSSTLTMVSTMPGDYSKKLARIRDTLRKRLRDKERATKDSLGVVVKSCPRKTSTSSSELDKLLRVFDIEPVKVIVGTGTTQTFWIPQFWLCACSAVFRAMLTSGFKETYDGFIKLPSDSPKVFSYLVRWMAQTHLAPNFKSNVSLTEELCHVLDLLASTPATRIFQYWILGDKYDIPDFQDRAISLLDKWYSACLLLPDDVKYVYDHTLSGCKLRLFMIEQFHAQQNALAGPKEDWVALGTEFAADALQRVLDCATFKEAK
ncbi:MAG: hypothetical protein M1834_008264 [Cirrosporium novae-zelandiae]|nr:MAG: hypothetical protein M1834_008264 [Cirrosporium novae-zelandiae]